MDKDGDEEVEEGEALGEVDSEGSDPEADREAGGVVLGVVVALGEVVVDSGDDRVGLGEELELSVWVLVTVPDPLSLKELVLEADADAVVLADRVLVAETDTDAVPVTDIDCAVHDPAFANEKVPAAHCCAVALVLPGGQA